MIYLKCLVSKQSSLVKIIFGNACIPKIISQFICYDLFIINKEMILRLPYCVCIMIAQSVKRVLNFVNFGQNCSLLITVKCFVIYFIFQMSYKTG